MEESNSKIKVIVGLVLILAVIAGGVYFFVIRNKKLVTPLPNESTLRVIFISPTETPASPTSTPSATLRPTKVVQPTTKPTVTSKVTPGVTISPTVTTSASPSATPKP
ncbi:hypothetical protein HY407_03445 [Candidatus Gottesmanbacteria bacterium]|nr:hypothetical protein [Candidatus Gottesmanbacteria bacterium]